MPGDKLGCSSFFILPARAEVACVHGAADCRARDCGLPCGTRRRTLREVLEYLPQSTRVFSAKYAGGLRPPFVRLLPFCRRRRGLMGALITFKKSCFNFK